MTGPGPDAHISSGVAGVTSSGGAAGVGGAYSEASKRASFLAIRSPKESRRVSIRSRRDSILSKRASILSSSLFASVHMAPVRVNRKTALRMLSAMKNVPIMAYSAGVVYWKNVQVFNSCQGQIYYLQEVRSGIVRRDRSTLGYP